MPPVSVARLFDVKDAGGAGWLGDAGDTAGVVLSTNIDGRFNLWRVPHAGAAPERLTTSDARQIDPVVAPDRRSVVFETDRGGGEFFDLMLLAPGGDAPVRLTDTPDYQKEMRAFRATDRCRRSAGSCADTPRPIWLC